MITAQQFAAALRAAAQALDGADASPGGQSQIATQTLAAPAAVVPVNITADQLTGLILPHIANEAIKAALGEAMRAHGVGNLPEAQPSQYPALYAAFQAVLARFGVGGAAPAQAAPSSII